MLPAVPAALLLNDLRFSTRLQCLRDAPEGWQSWEDGFKTWWDSGRTYSLKDYAKIADEFARKKLGMAAALPTTTVEAMYWRERLGRLAGVGTTVEYGNDVDGTGFFSGEEDPLGRTKWNLNVSI